MDVSSSRQASTSRLLRFLCASAVKSSSKLVCRQCATALRQLRISMGLADCQHAKASCRRDGLAAGAAATLHGNRMNGAEPLHTAAEPRFLTEVTETRSAKGHREGKDDRASRAALFSPFRWPSVDLVSVTSVRNLGSAAPLPADRHRAVHPISPGDFGFAVDSLRREGDDYGESQGIFALHPSLASVWAWDRLT
jgi:hypothetical protein